jgi:hypothetical protein
VNVKHAVRPDPRAGGVRDGSSLDART